MSGRVESQEERRGERREGVAHVIKCRRECEVEARRKVVSLQEAALQGYITHETQPLRTLPDACA